MRAGFHLGEGLFFERLANGDVKIIKTVTSHLAAPVLFEQIVPAAEWADAIDDLGAAER